MEQNGKAELTKSQIDNKRLRVLIEYICILIALVVMAVLSYDLYCNMLPNWQYDPKHLQNRITVITLAMVLLVMSMVACYYVKYRLLPRPTYEENFDERTLFSTNSQVCLLTSDLPPSYESICIDDKELLPPPYSIIIMSPVKMFTVG